MPEGGIHHSDAALARGWVGAGPANLIPVVGAVTDNIMQYMVIVTWRLSTLAYILRWYRICSSLKFHADQALKGLLFDMMQVFGRQQPQTNLHVSAIEQPLYATVVLPFGLLFEVCRWRDNLDLLRCLAGKPK
jgi:hypothetical protein